MSDDQFFDALDASVELGSGYICVVGPPSSGKTSRVLEFLVGRERLFNEHLSTSPPPAGGNGTLAREFAMEYMSARSTCGDTLAQVSHRMQLNPSKRRRVALACSPLEFGYGVTEWLRGRAAGSELHIVIDDADVLQESSESINSWMSNCLNTSASVQSCVCVWLVSQLPLRIHNCYRFHLVSPPSVEVLCAWLSDAYLEYGGLSTFDHRVDAANGDVVLTEQETNDYVLEAVRYYATHRPMSTTVVAKDIRCLVKRVYQTLPALVAFKANGEAAATSSLNAIHFASAWGKMKSASSVSESATAGSGGGGADPLVRALKRIGYSAVLLAFAAFYCGAVPKRKQFQAFGHDSGLTHRRQETQGQSHKAAVLTASAHVISVPRLILMYQAMLRMCVEHIDPAEFTAPELAVHFLHGFVAWGILTPVLTQKTSKFHCWTSVSTAQRLGNELSLNLFDLIPT